MTLVISNTYNFAANKKFDKVSNVSGNKITLKPLTNTKAGQWMLLWDTWTGIYDLIYINSIDPVNNCVYTKYPPRNSYSPSNGDVVLTEIIYDHDSVVIDTNAIVTTNNIINDNGGIVAIFTNSLTINGKIDVSGKGFKGGASVSGMYDMYGKTGYGPKGGLGVYRAQNGSNATQNTKSINILLPGSGGGSGGVSRTWGNGTATSGYGGNGGGCVLLICKTLTMNSGIINTSGQNGGSPSGYRGCAGSGGKGADGSVVIYASTQNLTSSTITQTAYSQSSTLVLPDWNNIANKYLFQDGTEIKKYTTIISQKDVVSPLQISNTNVTPFVVSASSNSYATVAWKAFDDNDNQGWYSNTLPAWIQIDLGVNNAKKILKYTITGNGVNSPKDWTLRASNDGTSFTTLDTKSNQIDWGELEKREFIIPTPSTYRYYQINITAHNGGSRLFITEIELIGEETSLQWEIVGTAPVTKEMFDQYGMIDLSIIDNNAIQQLTSDTPELLCWTDETGANVTRQTNITAVPFSQLILPIGDIDVEELESVNLQSTISGTGDIKLIVSGDSGTSWKGKNGIVDISDLAQVTTNGFAPDELNALNKEELATLFPNGKARFAFYLEQEKSTDIVQINSLKINEKVYTMTPSIENLSVLYELLESEKPTIYVSRDDGVNWKEAQPDTLTKLDDLPEGNKLRVKIVLQNGQELYGLSYSWI